MRTNVLWLLGLGSMFVSPSLLAGDWKLKGDASDSITLRIVQVDRSGEGSSDDSEELVSQISPRISLERRGARASADISYRLNLNLTQDSKNTRRITHDLIAKGDVEAIEDLLIIKARAGAKLVGSTSSSGTVDSLSSRDDSRQSYSFQISPQLRHTFDNRYVTVVSNNSFDLVDYTGGDNESNDNSTSNSYNLGLRNGPIFTTFDWDVGVTQRVTSYEDRDDTRTDYSAGIGYRIDAQWRLNARAGWEENDIETDRDDTDGVTWNLGGQWTPNPRTSLDVDYGSRYFGETYSVRARHRSRKTTLSFDVRREVSNRRSSRLVDSFFILVDENNDPIVDPETGNLIVVNLPSLRETDEDFLNTQFRTAISVKGRRTTVSLTGDIAQREYETSDDEEDAYGLGLSVSRRMGADLTASITANYDHADGSSDNDSDTYDVGLRLSKRFGRKTSASLDFLHRDRDASNADDSYTENRIGVSISTSFL